MNRSLIELQQSLNRALNGAIIEAENTTSLANKAGATQRRGSLCRRTSLTEAVCLKTRQQGLAGLFHSCLFHRLLLACSRALRSKKKAAGLFHRLLLACSRALLTYSGGLISTDGH